MKYMGHKGRILASITEAIGTLVDKKSRIADPFSGSGIVSWHLAHFFPNAVWASDLQRFACARTKAVLERKGPSLNGASQKHHLASWLERAVAVFEAASPLFDGASAALPADWSSAAAKSVVLKHREAAKELSFQDLGLTQAITSAYGGHYFSVPQALMLDALRSTIPPRGAARLVALSALIGAASKCAASPGHTAQPFQPTVGASKWLLDAWKRDPVKYVNDEWTATLEYRARTLGKVIHTDATSLLRQLQEGDVAFIDPPYSGVHYSRFYHVLETLAIGKGVIVTGRGRYPPPEQRPVSSYSQRGKSHQAMTSLLEMASTNKVRLVITFPIETQSNGLSAELIAGLAKARFDKVSVIETTSNFSSLGGTGNDRAARRKQVEAIICAY